MLKESEILTQKNLRDIGMVVAKVHPQLAGSILQLIQNTTPSLTDLELIPALYSRFKQFQSENMVIATKRDVIYSKHIFITMIIQLYNPEILTGFHYCKLKKHLR